MFNFTTEEIVVYFSKEDKNNWIAHSLTFGQVGVGKDPIEAIRGYIRGFNALFETWIEDSCDFPLFRKAPEEIQDLKYKAKIISSDLFQFILNNKDFTELTLKPKSNDVVYYLKYKLNLKIEFEKNKFSNNQDTKTYKEKLQFLYDYVSEGQDPPTPEELEEIRKELNG